MKILKRKIFLISFLAILIFLFFLVFSGYINTSQVTKDDALPTFQDNPEESLAGDSTTPTTQENSEETIAGDSTTPTTQENSEETFFVVPESPMGTLGLISASAAAFAVFTIIKKKQRSF